MHQTSHLMKAIASLQGKTAIAANAVRKTTLNPLQTIAETTTPRVYQNPLLAKPLQQNPLQLYIGSTPSTSQYNPIQLQAIKTRLRGTAKADVNSFPDAPMEVPTTYNLRKRKPPHLSREEEPRVKEKKRRTAAPKPVETLSEKVIRILEKQRIIIGDEEADTYAERLENSPRNTEIQVAGHHRALKLNKAGTLSTIHRRPPAGAGNMRVSPFYGPMKEDEISMINEGRFPITGGVVNNGITIKKSDLADIKPRASLSAEMGGSAAQLSKIEHSEWLHAVAHSLGGEDKAHNLAAGPHALNTAMIPFETAIKKLVYDNRVVDYSVNFFTNYLENGLLYIHHVEIGIQINGAGRRYWTLFVNPSNIGQFINGGVLDEIQQIANGIVATNASPAKKSKK